MARYIDADKSVGIGYLSDWYQNSIDDTKPPIWTDEHIEELTNDFIVILKDAPTADVVEVKYGEWKKSQFTARSGFFTIMDRVCSECKIYVSAVESSFPMKYCPHCGAKMDGGKEE